MQGCPGCPGELQGRREDRTLRLSQPLLTCPVHVPVAWHHPATHLIPQPRNLKRSPPLVAPRLQKAEL
eukprot:13120711-Alexandrium_andersonii.AAC.1